MLMWIMILGAALIVFGAVLCFLTSRVRQFGWIPKLAGQKKRNQYLLAGAVVIGCAAGVGLWLGVMDMLVCVMYLALFWLLCDGLVWLLRLFLPGLRDLKCCLAGILAIALTLGCLSMGWYNDHHVKITEYTVTTQKAVSPLKLVLISDVHIGALFDGEGFGKHIDTINSLQPDAVALAGDFIDGSSKDADILSAAAQLGRLEAPVFFVFGNHDKNHYGEENKRELTSSDLIEALTASGVTVLEDSFAELPGGYTVLGRRDKAERSRADIGKLMQDIPGDSYVIDLNHQPNDYEAESLAGVDLVLSGHTHGGQFRLIRDVGLLLGANDRIYGHEKRRNTDFIVSSGISNWALHFKTGCSSEIVVITVLPEQQE